MATLEAVVDAFTASREFDRATISRLAFWVDELGGRELTDITDEDVDAALIRLAERGRLKPSRNHETVPAGRPLRGSSINRYITQLGSVYKYARRLRLVPRSYVPPTRGIEKSPEPPDPERYLRPEEVERLIKVARVLDRRWGRMVALILFAHHTGLRVGNLMQIRWREVDLVERTATVSRTKNGEPIVCALSARLTAELERLPGREPDALVFEGRTGRPHTWRRLWGRVCAEAGLAGRNFHQLRHGCGYALAAAGINQAQIMAVLGHRTLSASARYMHHSTDDKRAVIERVFNDA